MQALRYGQRTSGDAPGYVHFERSTVAVDLKRQHERAYPAIVPHNVGRIAVNVLRAGNQPGLRIDVDLHRQRNPIAHEKPVRHFTVEFPHAAVVHDPVEVRIEKGEHRYDTQGTHVRVGSTGSRQRRVVDVDREKALAVEVGSKTDRARALILAVAQPLDMRGQDGGRAVYDMLRRAYDVRAEQTAVNRAHVRKQLIEAWRRSGCSKRGASQDAEQGQARGEGHGMEFDLIDSYLLEGVPQKSAVIAALLEAPPALPAAAAFLEGLRLLGTRTPDLALVALRLVLAGKPASDEAVVELKMLSDRARSPGGGRQAAIDRYRELVKS